MSRYNIMEILLTDEDEDGVETEVEVLVHFSVQPAEPDVGIPNRYGEVQMVAMPTPLGELIFEPTDYHTEQLTETLQDAIYESQFTDDERY
jgi:hypothetical protein